ncbi:MAG: DUF4147 domain-containing protein [bacterium]|nr:DUF4147 domain-containing protein [bacterium]
MENNLIKNIEELSTSPLRKKALEIINSGLSAVSTQKVLKENITLTEDTLTIKNNVFDLTKFDKLIFIGLGKAASEAALFFDELLGQKISAGAVLDLKEVACQYIKSYKADHPRPSAKNIIASQKVVDLADGISEKDLVIAVISGGGSAMLCWPAEECEQSVKLYDSFLKTGGNIEELNTIRKHTSQIKGGGLAKLFYPAKIVGLIFSDIPGDNYDKVASGPTFLDESSAEDAQKILNKYAITDITLNETLKEEKYFTNVLNINLVSNKTALEKMKETAENLGFDAFIMSSSVYENTDETISNFKKSSASKKAIIAGGEISISVTSSGGKGGRNQYIAIKYAPLIKENEVFVSVASDGLDNSNVAGAIIDKTTMLKAKEKELNNEIYLKSYDTYDFFNTTKDLIFTGPTGANVADLMLLLID